MDTAIQEFGETARYALDDDARTGRLAMLMMVAAVIWQLMF